VCLCEKIDVNTVPHVPVCSLVYLGNTPFSHPFHAHCAFPPFFPHPLIGEAHGGGGITSAVTTCCYLVTTGRGSIYRPPLLVMSRFIFPFTLSFQSCILFSKSAEMSNDVLGIKSFLFHFYHFLACIYFHFHFYVNNAYIFNMYRVQFMCPGKKSMSAFDMQ
jgi:hypothetical protein